MPAAMPSQSATPRKPIKPRRKLTTLSFEQLDRGRTSIFTEDISSSSRIRKPSYVLRQGDVVGANMPDTIKLAKHRSKIYVGLSDTSSIASGRRESRGVCRSDVTSSAATTIGKASIIDWTDAASDVSGNVPMAGELSFILPPVQGVPNASSHHTAPGLDTTDIFKYRTVQHKRKGDKSPRNQPPSRGGQSRTVQGFRPPQNTPFLAPGRSDDFVATFRKKVTPRTTLERCNVVVCGGGIGPMPGMNRETRQKTILYARESNNTNTIHHNPDKRRNQTRDNINANNNNNNNNNNSNPAGMGVASFDLPVIDLKCVESPIADLGDLEQKGIRLVKLKTIKKKRRYSQSSDPDKNGSLTGDINTEDVMSAVNERLESADRKSTSRTEEKELEPSFGKLALNGVGDVPEVTFGEGGGGEDADVQKRKEKRSITSTSTTSSERSVRNGMDEEIGTNRGSYTTPLLPNLDTNRTDNNSRTERSPYGLDIQDSTRLRVDGTATDTKNTTKTSAPSSPNPGIKVVVENLDPTPINPPIGSGSTTPNTNLSPRSPRDDGYVGDTEGQAGAATRRRRHRTSSLLSVPASVISECRPPSPPGRESDGVFEDITEDGNGSAGRVDPPVVKIGTPVAVVAGENTEVVVDDVAENSKTIGAPVGVGNGENTEVVVDDVAENSKTIGTPVGVRDGENTEKVVDDVAGDSKTIGTPVGGVGDGERSEVVVDDVAENSKTISTQTRTPFTPFVGTRPIPQKT